MTKPVKLHVGYVGITREGKRVEITNNDLNDTKWPWLSNHGQWYNGKGLAANYYKNSPQELDIVGPWVDTPVEPPVDYNDGKWHRWAGGECPVHTSSVVQIKYITLLSTINDIEGDAGGFVWDSVPVPIVAFRVTKEYVKAPREFWVMSGDLLVRLQKPEDTTGYIHVREVLTDD
jgi:hypothetical protein